MAQKTTKKNIRNISIKHESSKQQPEEQPIRSALEC